MRILWLALVWWVPVCLAVSTNVTDTARQLIPQLGDAKFTHRQATQNQLIQLGDQNHELLLDACVRAYGTTTDPEVKSRLREVMRDVVRKYEFGGRGFLGIAMRSVTVAGENGVDTSAVEIMMVNDGTPAAQAGLETGDQLVKIDDLELNQPDSMQAFTKYVQSRRPGSTVKLTTRREGAVRYVVAKLAEMPPELLEMRFGGPQSLDEYFVGWLDSRLEQIKSTK